MSTELVPQGGEGGDVTKANGSDLTAKAFDSGVKAVATLADVADKSGTKNTVLATGIVILLFATTSTLIAGVDLGAGGVAAGIVMGGALVLAVLISTGLDYRAQLNAELRRVELDTKRYEVDTRFRIELARGTPPAAGDDGSTQAPGIPGPPR